VDVVGTAVPWGHGPGWVWGRRYDRAAALAVMRGGVLAPVTAASPCATCLEAAPNPATDTQHRKETAVTTTGVLFGHVDVGVFQTF